MSDSFSHSVRLETPRTEAWPRLHDAATWAGVAGITGVSNPSHDDSGHLESFDFVVEAGGSKIPGSAKVIEVSEPELFRIDISSAEIMGHITVRLASNDASGTKLRVLLEMRAKGFLAGMFYPLIAQTVGKGLPDEVEALGASPVWAGRGDHLASDIAHLDSGEVDRRLGAELGVTIVALVPDGAELGDQVVLRCAAADQLSEVGATCCEEAGVEDTLG